VFLSSHLMSELEVIADHVVIIGRGRLLADAAVDDLVDHDVSLEEAYVRLTEDAGDHRNTAAGGV